MYIAIAVAALIAAYQIIAYFQIDTYTREEIQQVEQIKKVANSIQKSEPKLKYSCSCIETARAAGVQIPINTDADDLQPNTVPKVGGLILLSYPKAEHVAKIERIYAYGYFVYDGIETTNPDGTKSCTKGERLIAIDDSHIRGFWSADNMSPEERKEITELIVKYAEEKGVDKNLALNIACAESCTRDKATGKIVINPKAKNPSSSATGVFQIIDSTWHAMCEGDADNIIDNIKCGTHILAQLGSKPWEASKHAGFGGGWAHDPYFAFAVAN